MVELNKTANGRRSLSGWPMTIGWIAMIIFALHASTHMVGAGDTWVALACGRHFYNHGVDTVEPFSANSHHAGPTEETMAQYAKDLRSMLSDTKNPPSKTKAGLIKWWLEKVENYPNWSDGTKEFVAKWHPTGWVNQNWLTHVIFYWLTHESPFADAESRSFNTLVYWKFALYILCIVATYYIGRVLGAHPVLSAVFACFAMFIGRSFFDIRPAGYSNLLVAIFLLILVLATYRNILYMWLMVPLTVFWCNVHGGYLYVFLMLVPFVGLHFILSFLPKERSPFVCIGMRNVIITAAVGIVSFVAMVVFNPFHLTNLTHTFIISVSKHAEMWRQVNEWHPAFEWSNPVGDEQPFLYMFILVWLLLVLWIVVRIVFGSGKTQNQKSASTEEVPREFQWPKIDIAYIFVAAMTIYMAIRSRRFIPVAAIAACPYLALLVDQMICAVSAYWNKKKNSRFAVAKMPLLIQQIVLCVGAAAVLFFGIFWGLQFKTVYLDPWPTDAEYNSIFMRMTASDAKPFRAGDFIRMNRLDGKMFNYWTEGGFIGWIQDPDPETGKTPLQLFMDGRAQAAYEPRTYREWQTIMAGGPVAARYLQASKARGKDISNSEYRKIGEWISKVLRSREVWLTMMPQNQFEMPFVKGLEADPDWQIVFVNDKQKILVDVKSQRGKELFDGIFSGKTVYPDQFHKDCVWGYLLLRNPNPELVQKGFERAVAAFRKEVSPTPVVDIIVWASRHEGIKEQVDQFCREYFVDFLENKEQYMRCDGARNYVESARLCALYFEKLARIEKRDEDIKKYRQYQRDFVQDMKDLMQSKRW